MTDKRISACLKNDCVEYAERNPNTFDLIVADPPYNYGQNYAGYHDNDVSFTRSLRKWILSFSLALNPRGSLWLFIPDEWVSIADIHARQVGLNRRAWIVWYYTFGVNCKNNFTRSHTHILYFTKNANHFTFNKDAIPSWRQLSGDKRAAPGGRHADNTWILHPSHFPEGDDVWLESRICGTFKERQPHSPNQLPLAIVDRIVKVSTNPDDIVYDPFMGTGTVGVACKQLGRNYVGTDISEECVTKSKERIDKAVVKEKT